MKCSKLDPSELRYQSSEQYLIVCLRLCNLIIKNECSIGQLIDVNSSEPSNIFVLDSPQLLSHLNSSECHKYSHKESHKMTFFLVGVLLCLTILTLNFFTLITILKSRRLQSIQNILIANLSISDFLSGISFMYPCLLNLLTIYALETYNSSLYSLACMIRQYHYMCLAGYSPMITSMLSSMFTLSLLALEKYMAVVYPYFYERIIDQKKTFCYSCIVFSWLVSILVSLLPLMGWNEINHSSYFVPCMFEKIFTLNYILLFTGICCICALSMLFIYIRIYLIARKHSRQIAKIHSIVNNYCVTMTKKPVDHNEDKYVVMDSKLSRSVSNLSILVYKEIGRRNSSPAALSNKEPKVELKRVPVKVQNNLNMNMKAMKTLLILLLGFYISWLPLIIYFLAFASKSYDNLTIYVLMFIACCNACIDPLVYAFRNKDFLKALIENFGRWPDKSWPNLQ